MPSQKESICIQLFNGSNAYLPESPRLEHLRNLLWIAVIYDLPKWQEIFRRKIRRLLRSELFELLSSLKARSNISQSTPRTNETHKTPTRRH
jgi:hypothetical protein